MILFQADFINGRYLEYRNLPEALQLLWSVVLGASSVYGTLVKRTNDIILFEMRNLGSWMLNNDCF